MSAFGGDWRYLSREGDSSLVNIQTFTVPDREVWQVLSLWVEYTAGTDIATRQIRVQIRDDTDDVMMELAPGVTVTASQTRFFHMYPGAADLTAARDTDYISTPIPAGLLLRPQWDLEVVEESSASTINAAGASDDNMTVQLMYAKQSVLTTDGATPFTSDN